MPCLSLTEGVEAGADDGEADEVLSSTADESAPPFPADPGIPELLLLLLLLLLISPVPVPVPLGVARTGFVVEEGGEEEEIEEDDDADADVEEEPDSGDCVSSSSPTRIPPS